MSDEDDLLDKLEEMLRNRACINLTAHFMNQFKDHLMPSASTPKKCKG